MAENKESTHELALRIIKDAGNGDWPASDIVMDEDILRLAQAVKAHGEAVDDINDALSDVLRVGGCTPSDFEALSATVERINEIVDGIGDDDEAHPDS